MGEDKIIKANNKRVHWDKNVVENKEISSISLLKEEKKQKRNEEQLDLAQYYLSYIVECEYSTLYNKWENIAYKMSKVQDAIEEYGEDSEEVINKKKYYISKLAATDNYRLYEYGCCRTNIKALKFISNNLTDSDFKAAVKHEDFISFRMFIYALLSREENNYVCNSEKFKEGMKIFLRIKDNEVQDFYNDFILNNNDKKFNIPDEMKKDYLSLINDRFQDKENQSFDINVLNTKKVLNSKNLNDKNIGQAL